MDVGTAQFAAATTLRKLLNATTPDLVPHHLRTITGNSQGGGASVTNYRGGLAGEEGTGALNDGPGMAYLTRMKCFDGPENGYHASMGFPFFGRALGILFMRHSQAYGVTAMIDKVPYPVYADQIRTGIALSTSRDQAHAIVATDLDDGPHWGEIYVSPDPAQSGAIVRQVDVGGILVDRASGYTDPARFSTHMGPTAITSTPTAIVQGPSGTGAASRGLSALIVYNTHASTNRVRLKSGSLYWALDLQATGSPGDSGTFSFDPPITLDSTWTIEDQDSSSLYVPVFSW